MRVRRILRPGDVVAPPPPGSGRGSVTSWVLVTLAVMATATGSARADDERVPSIVLLHSYHEGFTWSDSITRGVRSAIDDADRTIELRIEYLDTRHAASDAYLQTLRTALETKYAETDIDVLVCADDHALDFALGRARVCSRTCP